MTGLRQVSTRQEPAREADERLRMEMSTKEMGMIFIRVSGEEALSAWTQVSCTPEPGRCGWVMVPEGLRALRGPLPDNDIRFWQPWSSAKSHAPCPRAVGSFAPCSIGLWKCRPWKDSFDSTSSAVRQVQRWRDVGK